MNTPKCRPPAVAGMFYPAEEEVLRRQLSRYMDQATGRPSSIQPKAIISPHAGYMYSGPVAAIGYRQVQMFRESIKRVVIIGPSHRVWLKGMAASTFSSFNTPLGDIPLDMEGMARLTTRYPAIQYEDTAHQEEHSLEVQLPFLQLILDNFQIIPLVVGDADPEDVAAVILDQWQEPATLTVISSDLSHYLTYTQAQVIDRRTAEAINSLDPAGLSDDSACGRIPIRGLLLAAKKCDLRVQELDLRNSGDTAGSRDQVVGYGAWAFFSD